MKTPYLAICDCETRFALRLADYFNDKEDISFRIGVFTNQEKLEEYLKQQSIDVLLISEEMLQGLGQEPAVETVIILEEGNSNQTDWENKIYKFQRAENIWKEVCRILSEQEGFFGNKKGNHKMKLQLFYSPGNRWEQMKNAFEYAKREALSQRVLFLSIDMFSAIEMEAGVSFSEDLTDLVCFQKSDSNQFAFGISAAKQSVGRLDILPVVKNPEDLFMIEREKWLNFLDKLRETQQYDLMVIDLGCPIRGFLEILGSADQIFQISSEKEEEMFWMNRFDEYLQFTGYEHIQRNIIRGI